MTARIAIEPYAAGLLAENGSQQAHRELQRLIDEIPTAWETGGSRRRLPSCTADWWNYPATQH